MRPSPLDDLEAELLAAAHRWTARRQRRWKWTPSKALLAVAAALTLGGGGALAATQLLREGSPVAWPSGKPARAGIGNGVPIASSILDLNAQAPDPAGGPLWRLRVFHTTRGYACFQLGRVVRGQLGLLGIDHAFGDDNRFHELAPGVILTKQDCIALDSTGHAHLAIHNATWPASGDRRACTPLPANLPRSVKLNVPLCPADDYRSVDVGFAGPDATAVTYRTSNGSVRLNVEGPDGAYAIVQPSSGPTPDFTGRPVVLSSRQDFTVGQTPIGGVIEHVEYRDGTACIVKETRSSVGSCPDHAAVARHIALPPTRAVRAPVHFRLVRKGRHTVAIVSFIARAAVRGADSDYTVTVAGPDFRRRPRPGRQRCGSATSSQVGRDLHAGQHVTFTSPLDIAPCSGIYTATVDYRVANTAGALNGTSGLRYPGRIVGTDRAQSTVRG